MARDLGPWKQSRTAADASMLTELHRRSTEAVSYSQRTSANKRIFYYNVPSILAGPSAVQAQGRIVVPSGGSVVDLTPTYTVTASATSGNEGDTITFTVTTTNVADGTTLYWTISGTAVAADFSDDADNGTVSVTSGTGTVVRTFKSDGTTEGTQTFTLAIRTESASGTIVATSPTITINDTSIAVQYTWTEQSSAGAQPYNRLEMTSDGTTVISTRSSEVSGAQGPYISTDGGATWTRKVTGITFLTSGNSYTVDVDVARGNGTIMYAAQRRGFVSTLPSTYDKIYKSTNTGDNWTATTAPDSTWQSIACSSDGTIVLAGNSNSGDASYNGRWAISTDGGATWSPGATNGQWLDVAMSDDGTRMYAINSGVATFYRSANTGSTWATTSISVAGRAVACSSDGLTVLIGRGGSSTPMVSTNGGVSFTAVTGVPSGFWGGVAVSSNGSVMAALLNATTARVWISTDSGATWFEQSGTPSINVWSSTAINSDGTKILAGPGITAKPYNGVPAV